MEKQKVYAVVFCDNDENGTQTLAGVRSSMEQVQKFFEENQDYAEGDKWYWMVSPERIDAEEFEVADEYPSFFNQKGQPIFWICPNEKQTEIGDEISFMFHLNHGRFGEYEELKGTLVGIEKNKLLISNVSFQEEQLGDMEVDVEEIYLLTRKSSRK